MKRFEVRQGGDENFGILGFVTEKHTGFWFNSRCQTRNSRKAWATPEEAVSSLLRNGATLHEVTADEDNN